MRSQSLEQAVKCDQPGGLDLGKDGKEIKYDDDTSTKEEGLELNVFLGSLHGSQAQNGMATLHRMNVHDRIHATSWYFKFVSSRCITLVSKSLTLIQQI